MKKANQEKGNNMKRNKILSIFLLSAMVLGSFSTYAQDSRNRAASTVVADGLAQLPASNVTVFNQVMGEMARTGAQGVEQIAGMLTPADKGKNAKFEYALNGIVDFVTLPGNEKLATDVRKGLIASLDKVTDNPNKAFLLTLLANCGKSEDAKVMAKYITDDYLSKFAAQGLAKLPDCDNAVLELMKAGSAPKALLADVAYKRKIKAAEPILLSWLAAGGDATTLAAVQGALGVCGSAKSLKALEKAAKAVKFADDATSATDSYLQLLDNLGKSNDVVKAAKVLLKADVEPVQCAGLRLLIKNDAANASKYVTEALKSNNRDFRNAALRYGVDYAGKGIIDAVAAKAGGLSADALTDVVRWLGNSKATNQMNIVEKAIGSSNEELAHAGIEAAGKIGGDAALQVLMTALQGNYSAQAQSTLLSFNGNIGNAVVKALDGDANMQVKALELASQRHIHAAYDKVINLVSAGDATVSAAAIQAMKGVASKDNFAQLGTLLESASTDNVKALQSAMKNAIAAESQDEQYAVVNNQLKKSAKPQLYYPLLAQVGNEPALTTLVAAYGKADTRSAALDALMQVNNQGVINPLFDIAEAESDLRSTILPRYLQLVKGSNLNDALRYLCYRRALDLKPEAKIGNAYIKALGDVRTLQSLMLVGNYLGNAETALTAAQAVQSIAKNHELLGGDAVKHVLVKAKEVFAAQSDADSGYAVNELNGLIAKVKTTGFKKLVNNETARNQFALPSKYENFEMCFDWRSADESTLCLRSMPEVTINGNDGVSFMYGDKKNKETVNTDECWNTLYVKVVNDRLKVVSNGVIIAENVTMLNSPKTKQVNFSGLIKLIGKDSGLFDIRDLYINELATTPVFKLSADEVKQGYEVLFDGRTLDKWHGNKTSYVPEDGAIVVSAQYGGEGNLYTNKKYSDFVLRFEFCFVEEGANNGIGIRTTEGVDAAYEGMEIQVLDHDASIYKGLHPYQQHGSVYGVVVPKHVNFTQNKWNVEEIVAKGDNIKVTVNGEVITDCNIREACKGHNVAPDGSKNNPYTIDHRNHPGLFNKDGLVCFCGHGPGVKFRNVRILDLSKNKK